MAAKKSKSKPASPKGKAKPAAKKTAKKAAATKVTATKKAVPTKKKVAKKAVLKKAAPVTKKAAPAKKAASPAKKKAVPVTKKAAPEKKAAAPAKKKVAANAAPAKKAAKKVAVKAAPAKKKAAPKLKVVKSSHSASFINKQRQRLLDLRDELVDTMSGMTRDTIRNAPEGSEASGSGQHQGDAGSDAYDRDFALSVLANEQDALYEIEQALRRIQLGTYGVCEMSFNKIPVARLEAIPFARLTVDCQSQWEKEYGKRRFRPSNEVGFSGGNQLDDEDNPAVSLDEDDE